MPPIIWSVQIMVLGLVSFPLKKKHVCFLVAFATSVFQKKHAIVYGNMESVFPVIIGYEIQKVFVNLFLVEKGLKAHIIVGLSNGLAFLQ